MGILANEAATARTLKTSLEATAKQAAIDALIAAARTAVGNLTTPDAKTPLASKTSTLMVRHTDLTNQIVVLSDSDTDLILQRPSTSSTSSSFTIRLGRHDSGGWVPLSSIITNLAELGEAMAKIATT